MAGLGDINDLDRALDRLVAGEEPGEPSGIAGLIGVARDLRDELPLEMPASVIERHLALISEPAVAPAPAPPLRRRIAIVGLAAAVTVSLFGSAAFAASSPARPGDALFGVKRSFERVGLAMQRSRQSRTAYAFKIVQRRLADLRSAAGDNVAAERARAAYEEALAEADRLLGDAPGFSDRLLGDLQEQLHRHVVVLNELLDRVPEEARPGIERAIENASKAEEHAADGRGRLDQPGPPPARGGKKAGRSRS